MKFEESYIANLLTLRYDPSTGSSMRRIWTDFVTTEYSEPSSLFLKLIEQAVTNKIEVLGERRIAIALSGGVDSNLILSIIRRQYPSLSITALTVSFDDILDETQIVARACARHSCSLKVIRCSNPLAELDDALKIVREPRWNVYFYYVVREAANLGLTTLFTGDGGDELFGGYSFRYRDFLKHTLVSDDWKRKAQVYLDCHERDWVPDQNRMFGGRISFDWEKIYQYLRPSFENPLERLAQVFLADYNGKLIHDFIPTNAALANHFDVKIVAPLLDREIQEFSTHLHSRYKYDEVHDVGKPMLREILRSRGVDVPTNKIGFGIDLKEHWLRWGEKMVADRIKANSAIFTEGYVAWDWYVSALRIVKETGDRRYVNKLLGLVALEAWLHS